MFNKERKVRVVIFDKDLRAELGKYPVSTKGNKISIRRGGKRNFNPSFNETSHLVLNVGFGRKEPVYFVRNGAGECIDFSSPNPEIPIPDMQQVIEAAQAEIIKNLGKEKEKTPFALYLIVLLQVLMLVLVYR